MARPGYAEGRYLCGRVVQAMKVVATLTRAQVWNQLFTFTNVGAHEELHIKVRHGLEYSEGGREGGTVLVAGDGGRGLCALMSVAQARVAARMG
jgi:hypothetical protein